MNKSLQKARTVKSNSAPKASVPKHMEHDVGIGLENIGPEDVYPLELTPSEIDKLVENPALNERSLLKMLLSAIILAHPIKGASDDERLSEAMRALIGEKKGRRPPIKDYDILLDVAREYHRSKFYKTDQSLSKIIESAYAIHHPKSPPLQRRDDSPNPNVKRLMEKFKSHKNILLARVTRSSDPDENARLAVLRKICKNIANLGIAIDLNSLHPTENST